MNPTIRFSIRNPHPEIRNENIHASQKALSVVTQKHPILSSTMPTMSCQCGP
jgi:hypothetical protein